MPTTVASVDLNISGVQGPPGPAGPQGDAGPAGVGVPIGGAIGQVLAKASGTDYDTEWVNQSGGSGSLSYQAQTLSADVTLDVSNQWYGGPQISITAGTWLVFGVVHYHRAQTGGAVVGTRMRAGASTIIAASSDYHPSVNGINLNISTFAVRVATGSETITLEATVNVGTANAAMKAEAVTNGQGNNYTRIMAVKIA